jgi:hypothetical protein
MADLARVMEALRNADAAGNTEDARKLAVIANRLRTNDMSSPQQESRVPTLRQGRLDRPAYESFPDLPAAPERHAGAMPFVNRGIAGTVGAPADLIRSGVNALPGMDESNRLPPPIGGRESIEGAMESTGARLPAEGQRAQTIPEHMGQVVGENAAYMIPVVKTVQGLTKLGGTTGRVASNIYNSMIKHPYLTMTGELTASSSMGAGRGVAEEEFPDNPALKTTIELMSGLAGGMAPNLLANRPAMLLIRSGKSLYRKVATPLTKPGQQYRAGKYIKSLAADPEKAAKGVGEDTIAYLPPAVKTGEKKIVALYKSLVGQDPIADSATVEKLTNSIIKLDSEMRKLGYGSPELLEEITRKRIAAIELGMDNRIIKAVEAAEQKLSSIPASKRKAAESRVVKVELEKVMHAQRVEDKKLWGLVDKNFKTGFENTRATYKGLIDDLGKAQLVDVPVSLKSSPIIKNKKLESTTLREMQSLRSKLLETSRMARKEGQWNKSRIAEDVADSILVDLETASVGTEASDLKAALAATKNFKTRFESGEVGKILGYSKSGAPAINPNLTLEKTIGRMGEQGAIDMDKIVLTPEAHNATKRYIARSFTDYAAERGPIDPIKSERWIKNNEAILDQYPELRNQLADAAQSQGFADKTRVRMDARKARLSDPRISTSAEFLNVKRLDGKVDNILSSRRPSQMADELVKQAKKDPTGESLAGLKAGFVDHILRKSAYGGFNDIGERTLSGKSMLGFIKENESTLRMVFEPNQIARMRKVGGEFVKLENLAKLYSGRIKIEMTDWASSIMATGARMAGATIGGRTGGGSMGGSLQHAQIFSGRAKRFMLYITKDRTEQLISDAVLSDDPALLQSFLGVIAKPKPKKQDIVFFNKQLNIWLLSTGKRVAEDMETEGE